MRIKVCGMTRMAQLKELEEIGADFAGLIFYSRSPRCVLKSELNHAYLKKEKSNINKVGVFVNESLDVVLKTVDEWKLDMVQLHGDETPRYCEQVSNHVNTVKAFRIGVDSNIPYKVYPFMEAVDLFLFDSLGKQYGGTGEQFDWNLLKKANLQKPYFLSGGLGMEDLVRVQDFAASEKNFFSLDVNSRFELSPGIKNMAKLKDFITSIKEIN